MNISLSATIDASADAIWQDVSDFQGVDRYLAIITSSKMEGSGVGALRTLTVEAGVIVERLESLDEQSRTLSYSFVESPIPISGYLATMQVRETGDSQCELTWSSVFEPAGITEAEARDIIEGAYNMGFEGLRKLHGG
jgi:hypothetical protein